MLYTYMYEYNKLIFEVLNDKPQKNTRSKRWFDMSKTSLWRTLLKSFYTYKKDEGSRMRQETIQVYER